jgi:hypothetical protein
LGIKPREDGKGKERGSQPEGKEARWNYTRARRRKRKNGGQLF